MNSKAECSGQRKEIVNSKIKQQKLPNLKNRKETKKKKIEQIIKEDVEL